MSVKWKLRPEFIELPAALLHAIFPQITEATSLAQELGFKSPPEEDIGARLEDVKERMSLTALSNIGAVIGSPLGLLPILMDFYSSGVGQLNRLETSRLFETARLDPDTAIKAWLRGFDSLNDLLDQGISSNRVEAMKLAQEQRLDPLSVITAWRRGIEAPGELEDFFNDLREQGWSGDRIEALKKVTEVLPSPAELITWLAHEALEPDMVEKYGLDSDWEGIDKTWFAKIGMSLDVAKNHWRAHWVHPGLGTVFALLHRGEINEADVSAYYRLVETPEYWRDKLTKISWDLPNRIELRMMARYLELDKGYLVGMLQKVGLAEEYRSDVADFMIVMGVKSDLSVRYRNRWLTEEQLETEIATWNLSPAIADRVYKSIVKDVAPDRVEEQRRLTRALIVKGVKKEVITRTEGIELLLRHQNYGTKEAQFVLDVELGVMGSPETPLEFRQIVEEYRASQGEEFVEIPEEVIESEREALRLERLVKEAEDRGEPEGVIASLQAQLAEAQVRFRELLLLHGL